MEEDAPGEFSRDRAEMKEFRLENPTGWIQISRYEGVRLLLDAMLDAGSSREFSKTELAEYTGLSRETVRNKLEFLIDLDVIKRDFSWSPNAI